MAVVRAEQRDERVALQERRPSWIASLPAELVRQRDAVAIAFLAALVGICRKRLRRRGPFFGSRGVNAGCEVTLPKVGVAGSNPIVRYRSMSRSTTVHKLSWAPVAEACIGQRAYG